MKRNSILLASLGGAFVILPLLAQAHAPKVGSHAPPAQSDNASLPADSKPGERVFKQNCSRCHDEPQGFAPQICATVIRQMRVRASLSQSEEKQILSFFESLRSWNQNTGRLQIARAVCGKG
jgi:cytochrome c5